VAPRRKAQPVSVNDPKRLRRTANAGLWAGVAGLAAVGSIAGVTVARSMTRRTTTEDLYRGENFELLDADRSSVVTTPDGVDLAVREVGPQDAPLTVVFSHGFCLRMGGFHFQRVRLEEEWGAQVRLVFYDQRGHGQSDPAPKDACPLKGRWRDLGAVIEGPIVRQAEEVFLADWAFASGQSLSKLQKELPTEWPHSAGRSQLQVVASGPDVAGDPLYEGILSLVQQAQRSIWIVTPYFIPDEVLQRSLIVQARAGIDVRIVVPAKSNHPITDLARHHHLRELQGAGVKVLLYQSGMNHAKLLIVDGETTLFGSANMDLRSLFVNFEIGLVTYSRTEAERVRAWVEEVMSLSRPMSHQRRARKLLPAIGEEIARLLAPLL